MSAGSTLFEDYGAYHRDRRNLACHEIGIPLIVLAIVALLRLVAVPGPVHVDLAEIAIVATAAYYVALGAPVRAAALVAIVGLVLLYGSRATSRGRGRSARSSPAGSSSSSGTRTRARRPRS